MTSWGGRLSLRSPSLLRVPEGPEVGGPEGRKSGKPEGRKAGRYLDQALSETRRKTFALTRARNNLATDSVFKTHAQ